MTGGPPKEWIQEALARQAQGHHAAALLAFRKLLSRHPDSGEAWCNLSALLRELGRGEEALEAARKAVGLLPAHPDALANLGNALGDLGHWGEAVSAFRKALSQAEGHPGAQVNLPGALQRCGQLEEALAAAEEALEAWPARPETHVNRGHILLKLGRLEEAEAGFLRALALQEDNPFARWNLSFVRLLQGRWTEAWPDFDARLRLPEARAHDPGLREPTWKGEPFPGRTLLVWAEQGQGDTLQFVRFLPRVRHLGGRVLLRAQTPLLGVLATCQGVDQVLGEHEALPPFDLQIPLLSLAAVLGPRPEELSWEGPYLSAPSAPGVQVPPGLAASLQEAPGRKVGLAWAGNPRQRDDASRSLDPAILAPLAALRGVSWFSLQKPMPGMTPGGLPPGFGAVDLAPFLTTFSETAWVMERLDFLITVDSAPAHLAGALGLPTACLLSYSPDWRWLWGREDCPWYPSLRLVRQSRPGDWQGVVARLASELA